MVRDWIQQGTQWDAGDAVSLDRIELLPSKGTLLRGREQQITAVAHYKDGRHRVVTSLALFESNQSALATVDEQGLVTAGSSCNVSIMVRYQGEVLSIASIPLGVTSAELIQRQNFVDDHVFDNLNTLGIPPSPLCDDATFIRRVTLDIAGRLPTLEERRLFLADDSPNRREAYIDQLLKSPHYADYFANKWTALLKNRRDEASDITSNFAFHAWIRDSLLANVSYDRLVRELLAATGTVIANPAVAWYKRVKSPSNKWRTLLSFSWACVCNAQCHHHPFERWSQDDYYGLTAFFTRVGRKPTGTRGEDMIFHQRGIAESTNLKTGAAILPKACQVGEIGGGRSTASARGLAWEPGNAYFSKALVNRYWKHLWGEV